MSKKNRNKKIHETNVINNNSILTFFHQKYQTVVIGTLLLLGIIIYSNTFHSSFHFDDIYSIVNNFAIKNILNLQAIWYSWPTRFITYTTIALNYHFGQSNVFGYHLFNFVVHLCASIMVWWFMLLTFSTPAMNEKKITKYANLIAFAASLLFLTHPVQTQAVTYIIQRAASLATLFYLACLSLYVKSRLLQQEGNIVVSKKFYYSSLATGILAMFTKEMAITLPLMILCYEYYFLRTKEKFNWKYTLPLLATILIIPVTMVLTKSVDFMGMRRVLEPTPNIPPFHYLFTQLRVIVTYIRLLFIPINQNLDYDYHIAKNLLELPTLASLILLVSILIIAVRAFSKYRLLSFGIFWFFLTLLPESSVIPIKDVIFEHRLYLPMVGFSFFLASGIYYIFQDKAALKSIITTLLVIVSCYSILSYRRNFIWKDEITLWDDTVHKSPGKARPYYNRGFAYEQQNNLLQAISDYTKAIEIDRNFAMAYTNRGVVYGKQGNLSEAIPDLNKAIEINPNLAEPYNNRGHVYSAQGNLSEAASDYTKAIKINPYYVEAYNNRGHVYYKQGDLEQAMADFNKAIQISPNYADAYYNRSVIYYSTREYDAAWADVHKAEALGYNVNPKFLGALEKASGRGNY